MFLNCINATVFKGSVHSKHLPLMIFSIAESSGFICPGFKIYNTKLQIEFILHKKKSIKHNFSVNFNNV